METPVPNAFSKGRRYLKRRVIADVNASSTRPIVPAKKGSAEQKKMPRSVILVSLRSFNIAMENGPFIDDIPIANNCKW